MTTVNKKEVEENVIEKEDTSAKKTAKAKGIRILFAIART